MMETNMHYKTIVLELLKEKPEIQKKLRRSRTLLPTLNRYARELKANHERWKERLSQAKPGSNQTQIASEALEIALKELEDSLPATASPSRNEPLSLKAAMTFIRGRTGSK
jgi:hypothetical protein